jgi:hypothetical protein
MAFEPGSRVTGLGCSCAETEKAKKSANKKASLFIVLTLTFNVVKITKNKIQPTFNKFLLK